MGHRNRDSEDFITKKQTLKSIQGYITSHAKRILANPVAFKSCEGCDRTVEKSISVCPICRSYRFDPDPDRVRQRVSFRQATLEDVYFTLPRLERAKAASGPKAKY